MIVWTLPISIPISARITDATVTSRADLEAELETVRENGWASVREELEVGLNAVAAPVYDADAAVDGLSGLTLDAVAGLLGLTPATMLE